MKQFPLALFLLIQSTFAVEFYFLSGSSNVNQQGIYSTPASPGSLFANTCKLLFFSCSQPNVQVSVDPKGNVYSFGGLTQTSSGRLNQLWVWNTTASWNFLYGTQGVDAYGIYPTKVNQTCDTCGPGGRANSVSWFDSANNFYVFGGNGYGTSSRGYLNDLWRWNPTATVGYQWTWISGSSSPGGGNVTGSGWGNTPSARSSMVQWQTSTGDVFIFGGSVSLGSGSGTVAINDIWKWTEKNGWTRPNASFNKPAPRYRSGTWVLGNSLYLYGGNDGNDNYYADMWAFDTSASVWNFVGGFGNNTNIQPSYPAISGSTCAGNCHAGSRGGAASFTDSNGKLWLFGGNVYRGLGTTFASDLWRIDVVPGGLNWTQIAGPTTANTTGDYSNSDTSIPGSRHYMGFSSVGTWYLFGAEGFGSQTAGGILNDFWLIDVFATTRVNMTSTTDASTTSQATTGTTSSSTSSTTSDMNGTTIITGATTGTSTGINGTDAGITENSNKSNSVTIIAAVVSIVGFLAIAAAILIFILFKRRKPTEKSSVYLKNIEVKERIGGGNFGDVYRGIWMGTTSVALKSTKSKLHLDDFYREAESLQALNHPNLVRYLGLYDSGDLYIVMEFLQLGSLDVYIRENQSKLTQPDLFSMTKGAAAGMMYLESLNYVHRDLALRNLLVSKDEKNKFIVKVSDFGHTRKLENAYYTSTDKEIPVKWCSPEVLKYGKFSIKSDVWAFGVVLWEIFSYGVLPYTGMANSEVLAKLKTGYRMEAPERCPEFILELMNACWQEEPEDRPTFENIFKDLDQMAPGARNTVFVKSPIRAQISMNIEQNSSLLYHNNANNNNSFYLNN